MVLKLQICNSTFKLQIFEHSSMNYVQIVNLSFYGGTMLKDLEKEFQTSIEFLFTNSPEPCEPYIV